MNFYSSTGDSELIGIQFKVARDIKINEKEGKVEFLINNVLNTSNFSQISSDAFFQFESLVEAVPRFFLLKLDLPL